MPTTFFGWVGFLAKEYGGLFLRGTGVTLLIALTGTILGFLLGLFCFVLFFVLFLLSCLLFSYLQKKKNFF